MRHGRNIEFSPMTRPPRPRAGGDLLPWFMAIALAAALASVGWWLYSRNVAAGRRAERDAAVARQLAEHQAIFAGDLARLDVEILQPLDRHNPDAMHLGITAARPEMIVEDSGGELLWTSPTAGPPISLAFVPAGTQCLIQLRPALLAAHPECERILAALGPWGQDAAIRLRTLTGAEMAELESLLVAVVVRADGELDVSVRAELIEPWGEDELTRRFGEHAKRRRGATTIQVVGDRGVFLPPSLTKDDSPSRSRTLVACRLDEAEALVDSAGAPPPMVRDLEALLDSSDAWRAATILIAPKFLAAGGSDLLEGRAAALRETIGYLADDEAGALALSAHWDDNFFLELRAAPTLDVSPLRLSALLSERLATGPSVVADFILARAWPPYGRKVIARFPDMLRKLSAYTRRAEDRKQAVLRAYLPVRAGHNLIAAVELLLSQVPAGAGLPPPAADPG
jgi:hypothetical protein